MLKKIIEPLFAIVLMVTIPAELVAAMGMESGAGPWAVWLGVGCGLLQLTAMVAVKVAWGKGKEDYPSVTAVAVTPPLTRGGKPPAGGNSLRRG